MQNYDRPYDDDDYDEEEEEEYFTCKSRQNACPKMGCCGANMGLNIKFCISNPGKAYSCAEARLLTYFVLKFVRAPATGDKLEKRNEK